MLASRPYSFTHGDRTQVATEQKKEQAIVSTVERRQVLGIEPQPLRRTAQSQYSLPGFLLSIMRHFNRKARTSAKSIKWRNPTRELNFWVHTGSWDPRTLNYMCKHFSSSDRGNSIAKYGDQGCLQMFVHKLKAYDDTNLCTNDVACLSVRSIS